MDKNTIKIIGESYKENYINVKYPNDLILGEYSKNNDKIDELEIVKSIDNRLMRLYFILINKANSNGDITFTLGMLLDEMDMSKSGSYDKNILINNLIIILKYKHISEINIPKNGMKLNDTCRINVDNSKLKAKYFTVTLDDYYKVFLSDNDILLMDKLKIFNTLCLLKSFTKSGDKPINPSNDLSKMENICFLSYSKMTDILGVSSKTIKKSLDILDELELVLVGHPGMYKGANNIYMMLNNIYSIVDKGNYDKSIKSIAIAGDKARELKREKGFKVKQQHHTEEFSKLIGKINSLVKKKDSEKGLVSKQEELLEELTIRKMELTRESNHTVVDTWKFKKFKSKLELKELRGISLKVDTNKMMSELMDGME